MTTEDPQLTDIIWATRGRSWGFRFLLDAGLPDPLPAYERAFATVTDGPSAWRREADAVALRFEDPLGRRDTAGRLIPHEFVVYSNLADSLNSPVDGIELVWPLVADVYEQVWESPTPPGRLQLPALGND
ncbi:hypothetical protein K8W59_06625 [Nocardioides rotundus]|uniref:hypothetical protein n=1 Tax=Nocardioides rotundus TaxID=1774216 RepID=UPI001CBB2BE9|nr:hypothetical protein [Nocardioides rotundus]UAL31140.1 hypothetical protein K8W59_06625 [Nocardioides rotundus]